MAPKKLEKEEKVKKAITIEKKKEIVQTYESGVRVTISLICTACRNPPSRQSYKEKICIRKLVLLKVFLSQGKKGHQTANCCFW